MQQKKAKATTATAPTQTSANNTAQTNEILVGNTFAYIPQPLPNTQSKASAPKIETFGNYTPTALLQLPLNIGHNIAYASNLKHIWLYLGKIENLQQFIEFRNNLTNIATNAGITSQQTFNAISALISNNKAAHNAIKQGFQIAIIALKNENSGKSQTYHICPQSQTSHANNNLITLLQPLTTNN